MAVFLGQALFPLPIGSWWGNRFPSVVLQVSVLGLSYVTIYLGLGRLGIALLRRFSPVGMLLGVLLQVLMLFAGCGIPLAIHLMIPDLRSDWSLLEISNPIWTIGEIMDGGTILIDSWFLFFALPLAALGVFALNLPAVSAAVRHVRIAKPSRVAEEDALFEAARTPPAAPVPTSPWDS
jgi:hypothetical protein